VQRKNQGKITSRLYAPYVGISFFSPAESGNPAIYGQTLTEFAQGFSLCIAGRVNIIFIVIVTMKCLQKAY